MSKIVLDGGLILNVKGESKEKMLSDYKEWKYKRNVKKCVQILKNVPTKPK
jgi:hypothetical protein